MERLEHNSCCYVTVTSGYSEAYLSASATTPQLFLFQLLLITLYIVK